jgi:hypothetical protein
VRIKLTCAKCGSSRFTLKGEAGDALIMGCDDCGREIGTLGALKEQVGREVIRQWARSQDPDQPANDSS